MLIVAATPAFGADRALIIGIDRYQTVSDTPGSIADAEAMAALMQRKYKFPKDSIRILRGGEATAERIRTEIQNWLVDATNPGDRVFFFYSGHGGQVDDEPNGDEEDQLDEVLAPYDVYPGSEKDAPAGFIRDDEINLFLLKLSGRRVVMAFDSCHSGTISRSPEAGSKFVALKNKRTPFASTRSFSDRESYVPPATEGKDMHAVKEDFIDGRLNGIVIFSAARPYQKAMWLTDRSRGAFAYAFEMVQKEENYFPSVSELDRRIKEYLNELKRNKLVVTEQIPETQVISQTRIDDKPLFGEVLSSSGASTGWEAAVLPSIHNPLADFKVKLSVDSLTNTFKVDDVIKYSVAIEGLEPNKNAYLYILVFSRDDDGKKHVTSLFPTPAGNDLDNYLGNGTHRFPRTGKNGADYRTVALTPGKDVFVALVSKVKLPLGDKDEYDSWEEAYRLIGVDNLREQVERATRSWGNRPKIEGGNWQAASAVVYVK
jgi:hypothetical protein